MKHVFVALDMWCLFLMTCIARQYTVNSYVIFTVLSECTVVLKLQATVYNVACFCAHKHELEILLYVAPGNLLSQRHFKRGFVHQNRPGAHKSDTTVEKIEVVWPLRQSGS